ncbi:MAG: hypothetical protein J5I50_05600 [Chitinophagaceae bacterium]|nr:hypothetical protein [Chitinophagaceae bacterium]
MKLLNLTLLFSLSIAGIQAQDVKTEKVAPFKPPVVKTTLNQHADGDSLSAGEAAKTIIQSLEVKDAKGISYPVISYGFLYKKKSYIDNAETGKLEKTFTVVSDRFEGGTLPEIWIENIKDAVKPEEELYFFDILVKDSKGRKFNSPDLKFYIR